MLIEISDPVFKCEEDKNVFFSRLYAMRGFDGITAKGLNWHLSLTDNPKETVIQELQEICNIWATTFKVSGNPGSETEVSHKKVLKINRLIKK